MEEKNYIEYPEVFVVPDNEKKVCKLVESLYGLKQTAKQWHAKFHQTMLTNGCKTNEHDKCIYTPNQEVFVCLYMDDMMIMSNDVTNVKST